MKVLPAINGRDPCHDKVPTPPDMQNDCGSAAGSVVSEAEFFTVRSSPSLRIALLATKIPPVFVQRFAPPTVTRRFQVGEVLGPGICDKDRCLLLPFGQNGNRIGYCGDFP